MVSSFSFDIDLGGAFWIYENVKWAYEKRLAGDFRKAYRGHGYTVILDSSINKAGCFMKITKFFSGSWRNIIIPREYNLKGWRAFVECLSKIFFRDNKALGEKPQLNKMMKGGVGQIRRSERLFGEEIDPPKTGRYVTVEQRNKGNRGSSGSKDDLVGTEMREGSMRQWCHFQIQVEVAMGSHSTEPSQESWR